MGRSLRQRFGLSAMALGVSGCVAQHPEFVEPSENGTVKDEHSGTGEDDEGAGTDDSTSGDSEDGATGDEDSGPQDGSSSDDGEDPGTGETGNDPDPDPDPDLPGELDAHYIFVTAGPHTGDLKSIPQADNACQMRAENAGLDGSWRVLISDDTQDARDRIAIHHPVYNMIDEQVAYGVEDLWDGELAAPIRYDEFGDVQSGRVWTGSNRYGEALANTCEGWTVETGSGVTGVIGALDHEWMVNSLRLCSTHHRVYCISE